MLVGMTIAFLLLVGYAYVGYPLLVYGLGRLIRFRSFASDHLPGVSLIIAAYNEEDVIAAKLENVKRIDYPPEKLQVIVVTDGSSDRTSEVARRYLTSGVSVMHQPERRGKGAALNRAVAEAKGEILVFSDANAFYCADALRSLAGHYADPAIGAVSGSKRVRKQGEVGPQESLYWKYESFIRRAETSCGSTVAVVGEIFSMRRSLFTPIPADVINDDMFLALNVFRRGYHVLFELRAISVETAATLKDERARRRRIAAGRYQLMFRPQLWSGMPGLWLFFLFSHKFLRLLLPFLMTGALALNTLCVALGAGGPLLVFTLLAQLTAYGLSVLPALLSPARALRPAALAHYIVLSNLEALEGLFFYAGGDASPLWRKAARPRTAEGRVDLEV